MDQTNSSQVGQTQVSTSQNSENSEKSENTTKYGELLKYIREIVSLRTRLMKQNPDKKDLNNYKLLTKTFGAYYRIKDDPNIIIDSISKLDKIDNEQPQTNNVSKPTITYMFNDNDISATSVAQNDTDSDVNSNSDDRNIDELFANDIDEEQEKVLGDIDVDKMYRKSEILMKKAINSKKYVATNIDDISTTEVINIDNTTLEGIDTDNTETPTNNFKICSEYDSNIGTCSSSPKISTGEYLKNIDLTYVDRGQNYQTGFTYFDDTYNDKYNCDIYEEYAKSE